MRSAHGAGERPPTNTPDLSVVRHDSTRRVSRGLAGDPIPLIWANRTIGQFVVFQDDDSDGVFGRHATVVDHHESFQPVRQLGCQLTAEIQPRVTVESDFLPCSQFTLFPGADLLVQRGRIAGAGW